jgi:hypothetical protein
LEAAPQVSSLPSKEELLAFQSRWLRRAGLAAVTGAFLVIGALVLQRAGLHPPSGNSDADQLTFVHAHSSRLIYSSVIQGVGAALFVVPLVVLFRSASGRAERVRRAFIGLIVLGPLLYGVGVALASVGGSQAADKFSTQEPAVVQQARQHAEQATTAEPATPKQGKSTGAATTNSTTTTTAQSTTTATETTTTAAAKPQTPDQAASNAREGLADHLNKHTALLIAGGLISTIGALALVFGMIYTNLWAVRVGLATRFFGTVGMALGASLIFLGLIGLGATALWFAVLGLMFLGVWRRPLPPAWAAGEAVPWQRPGDDLGPPPEERGPSGTVEGSGREVSEAPLPENGQPDQPPEPPYGETQGQRRKKRKRRS